MRQLAHRSCGSSWASGEWFACVITESFRFLGIVSDILLRNNNFWQFNLIVLLVSKIIILSIDDFLHVGWGSLFLVIIFFNFFNRRIRLLLRRYIPGLAACVPHFLFSFKFRLRQVSFHSVSVYFSFKIKLFYHRNSPIPLLPHTNLIIRLHSRPCFQIIRWQLFKGGFGLGHVDVVAVLISHHRRYRYAINWCL